MESQESGTRTIKVLMKTKLVNLQQTIITWPGTFTAVGWQIPEHLEFDDWLTAIEKLKEFNGRIMWILGDGLNFGERKYGEVYSQVLDATDYAYQTLRHAAAVAGKIELCRRRHNLSFSHHQEVAYLEPEEQDRFLEAAEKHSLSKLDLRKAVNDYKMTLLAANLNDKASANGTYSVLVVDPPWPMEKIQREVRPNQAEFAYPVLNLEEIQNYKLEDSRTIPELAEKDCHFFLWTTQRFLPDAFRLLEVWNLNYVCTFTWHKPGGFQPYGLPQYNCEFALYARKGSPIFIDTKDFPLCFEAPRAEHSRKPVRFYEMIARVTAGRRAELFSREQRKGFESLGNETGKFNGQ